MTCSCRDFQWNGICEHTMGKMEFKLIVLYDPATDKHLVVRPDTPGDGPKEITLGGAVDLMKNVQRYEHDAWEENHPTKP